jgi:hypothetical protein
MRLGIFVLKNEFVKPNSLVFLLTDPVSLSALPIRQSTPRLSLCYELTVNYLFMVEQTLDHFLLLAHLALP